MPQDTTRLSVSGEWRSRATERRPALSIVVPCYNEEDNIEPLHRRVSDVSAAVVATDYELVLINDGSSDATWERIARICDSDPHVVGVNLSRNHGHQLALSAGLSVCTGRRILILDGDLQDPPELLPEHRLRRTRQIGAKKM